MDSWQRRCSRRWPHEPRSSSTRLYRRDSLVRWAGSSPSSRDGGWGSEAFRYMRILGMANPPPRLGWPPSSLGRGLHVHGPQPSRRADGPHLHPRLRLRWIGRHAAAKSERAYDGRRQNWESRSSVATRPGRPGRPAVLVRGRRYPIAGAVCMDLSMVDCGDDPVEPGDEVVLIGQQGDSEITAEEVAGWARTIPYELVAGLSPRVPRTYVHETVPAH